MPKNFPCFLVVWRRIQMETPDVLPWWLLILSPCRTYISLILNVFVWHRNNEIPNIVTKIQSMNFIYIVLSSECRSQMILFFISPFQFSPLATHPCRSLLWLDFCCHCSNVLHSCMFDFGSCHWIFGSDRNVRSSYDCSSSISFAKTEKNVHRNNKTHSHIYIVW